MNPRIGLLRSGPPGLAKAVGGPDRERKRIQSFAAGAMIARPADESTPASVGLPTDLKSQQC
jgi:hypothetical protein